MMPIRRLLLVSLIFTINASCQIKTTGQEVKLGDYLLLDDSFKKDSLVHTLDGSWEPSIFYGQSQNDSLILTYTSYRGIPLELPGIETINMPEYSNGIQHFDCNDTLFYVNWVIKIPMKRTTGSGMLIRRKSICNDRYGRNFPFDDDEILNLREGINFNIDQKIRISRVDYSFRNDSLRISLDKKYFTAFKYIYQ
tara:strand:+ start:297 stop:881 length:585 start_codon:yes stop_codon:yes gene_type:complete